MSKAQIPKPPKNIDKPTTIIHHISLNIRLSLRAISAVSFDFVLDSAISCTVLVPYFLWKDGLRFTSTDTNS